MRTLAAVFATLSLLAPSLPAAEPPAPLANDDARIAALGSAEEQARREARDQLVQAGPAAVPALLATMNGDNATAGKMAYDTLFRITQQTAGTPSQGRAATLLSAGLDAKNSVSTRRSACRLLSFVGGNKESVDALAGALDDPDIGEMARWALARIPSDRATQALTARLKKVEPKQRIGLIATLAERGDERAVLPLIEQTSAEDEAVREAAWNALARIPSRDSMDHFHTAVAQKRDPVAQAALLDYAATLNEAGLRQQAGDVLKLRLAAGPLSVVERCRVIRAYGRVGGQEGINYVLNALDDQDTKIRGTALEAVTVLPGSLATQLIARKMNSVPPPLKITLLEVLGRRGNQMDDRSMMIMYAAMLDKDDAVRIACIRATEAAGITATVPTLLNFMAGPAGPVSDATEHALAHLQGPTLTQDIVEHLARAPSEAKSRLLVILGRRGDPSVLPVLMQAASEQDAVVRAGAFEAMGLLQTEEAFDTLLAALHGAAGPDCDAAEKALAHLPGDAISGKLLTAYFDAPISAKPPMLRVLARRDFAGIPELLAAEARHPDATIREAAVRGLTRKGDPASADLLLEAAKRGPENVAVPAIDGCLLAASKLEEKDKAAAGRIFVETLKLAVTDQQKRAALRGIARAGDPADQATLALIVPMLKEGPARAEAATAVARFAAQFPESRKTEAIDLLQQVLTGTQDVAARRIAVQRLRELGVAADPARDEGFITRWWLLGPIPRGDEADWEAATVPREALDLQAAASINNRNYAWKPYHTPDPRGVVDLLEGLAPANRVVGYAYAEVTVPSAQEAALKLGSDDGIVVWLNGQKVHDHDTGRALVIDQDRADVSLRAGVNRILVKVLQAGGAWEFCLRVSTPDGQPVPLEQRLP